MFAPLRHVHHVHHVRAGGRALRRAPGVAPTVALVRLRRVPAGRRLRVMAPAVAGVAAGLAWCLRVVGPTLPP